jgi:GT2 family glycosyltransferase
MSVMSDIDISLIVVNYKTDYLLIKFLNSLDKFQPSISYELIIVDVKSDGLSNKNLPIYGFNKVTYLRFDDNVGYARACNAASSIAIGRNLAFFNADTSFINSDCIDLCSNYLDINPEVGAVGPLQVNSIGHGAQVTHAGIVGTNSRPETRGWKSVRIENFMDTIEVINISGSAYFTPSYIWREMMSCRMYSEIVSSMLGAPDGAFLPTPHFYEETYYSFHLKKHNYKVVYLGSAKMIHEWHKSSPVGSQVSNLRESKKIFELACEYHDIEC